MCTWIRKRACRYYQYVDWTRYAFTHSNIKAIKWSICDRTRVNQSVQWKTKQSICNRTDVKVFTTTLGIPKSFIYVYICQTSVKTPLEWVVTVCFENINLRCRRKNGNITLALNYAFKWDISLGNGHQSTSFMNLSLLLKYIYSHGWVYCCTHNMGHVL